MGIKNLFKFIKENTPSLLIETHLSAFAYKKVAVDTSIYMYKFKAICGDTWLTAFINLIISLRRNDIHAVFIFDNGAPVEKDDEKQKRKEAHLKLVENVNELKLMLESYKTTGNIDDKLKTYYNTQVHKRLLKQKDDDIDMELLCKMVDDKQRQIINIDKSDFDLLRQLFDVMQIPYLIAPLEAECCCADLCVRGLVDAALSDDSDLLAYCSPLSLSKINTMNDTVTMINHQELLDTLEMTKKEFVEFCIMLGTDYNTNIFKIGPKKSHELIKKHSSISEISKIMDVSILNHVRSYQLFTEYERHAVEDVRYCGRGEVSDIIEFFKINAIEYDVDKIVKSCYTARISQC